MSHSKQEIQLMIVLCVIGSGLYKSTSQTLVGSLFENDDPRKDGAFSMTYMFTNVGVLLGPFLCGLIANQWFAVKDGGEILEYGYRAVFLTTAIVIWFGAAFFAIGQKFFLKNMAVSATAKENLKEKKELAKVPLTTTEKRRMCVILILAFLRFSGLRTIRHRCRLHFICRILLILESGISRFYGMDRLLQWAALRHFRTDCSGDLGETFKNPAWGSEHFSKMSLGFAFLAVAFVFMIAAVMKTGEIPGEGAKASVLFIIAFITFQSIGEMCFAPVGYGMVNKLAPAKYASLLMGVWFASMFVANKLSGYVEVVIGKLGMLQVFIIIPGCLLVIGLLLFALNRKLEKLAQHERQ